MKKISGFIIALFFLQISYFAQGSREYPNRIVSLSPSITEILYELGLGNKVVGVTDHCNFPEDVKSKAKVGGYLNTNYEAIISLEPDLVIAQTICGEEIKNVFGKAGIGYMIVNTDTVDGILDSIEKIGQRCGAEDRAKEITAHIRKEVNQLRGKAKGKHSKRIMIVVGRNRGSFDNLYIAGNGTFYDELLNILGCENAYAKNNISYPVLSIEGILRLNPEIIIEMLPNLPEVNKPEVIAEWSIFSDVDAVKNNKVYVFNQDYVCIPGPRFTVILRDIAEAL